VSAGQEKKDICHLEGTGDYHVINIAEPAWQTHYDHGDGDVDGGDVPEMPGYVFDAECNVVSAVSCPCDFSPEVFMTLGIPDTITPTCEDAPGTTRIRSASGYPYFIVYETEDGYACQINEQLSMGEIIEFTNEDIYAQCAEAIIATAADLDILGCSSHP
jgi:hypothetical protein